jgi:hypothetical protein
MSRLALVVVVVGFACRWHPLSSDAPSCPWRTPSAEPGEPRCRQGDPWCGPDTLFACLDDLRYERDAARHLVMEPVQWPVAPRCTYDGECVANRGCGPSTCERVPPKIAPSGTSLENVYYVCGLNTTGENPLRNDFCGCVDHACAWFEQ